MSVIEFQFDPTGQSPNNLIVNEIHSITEANFNDYSFIIPNASPFFTNNLNVLFKPINGNATLLQEGVDYSLGLPYYGAVRAIGLPIYGALVFNKQGVSGSVSISYQTIGGEWINNSLDLYRNLAQIGFSPLIAYYEQIANLPSSFPPVDHDQKLNSLMGQDELIQAINNLATIIAQKEIALTNQMNALQGLLEQYVDNKINNTLITFLNNQLNQNS